jgi:hypothetical protein
MRSGEVGGTETDVPIETDECPACGEPFVSASETASSITFVHNVGINSSERRLCDVSKDELSAFASIDDLAAMAEAYQEDMNTDKAILRAVEQAINDTESQI